MDEIHFAQLRKPWKDDSLVNTNKRYGFNHGFKLVPHPQCMSAFILLFVIKCSLPVLSGRIELN